MSIGFQDSQCSLSSLDVFSGKNVQHDIEEGLWETYAPLANIQNGVVDFKVEGSKHVIDLQNTYIMAKVRIKNNDNTDLAAAKEVSVINYLGATLWKSVDVKLNGDQLVSCSNYPYRAYLEALTSYSENAKKSWLQAGLFYKDTHGQFNTITDLNGGYKMRKGFFETSKQVELIAKLHCEPFNQDRFLVDNVDLEVTLTKQDDNFMLMTADNENVKLVLEDVSLIVRKNNLFPDKLLEIQSQRRTMDVHYPINRVVVKTDTISQGATSHNLTGHFRGSIPSTILIGLVKNEAFAGKRSFNPFKFEHFQLEYINGKVGAKSITAQPFTFDFPNGHFLPAYWNFMQSMGYTFKDDGCYITRNEYDNDNFLLAYNLSPTLCNGLYSDPIETGNVTFEMRFKQALPVTVSVIMYADYSNSFSINTANKLVSNFQS